MRTMYVRSAESIASIFLAAAHVVADCRTGLEPDNVPQLTYVLSPDGLAALDTVVQIRLPFSEGEGRSGPLKNKKPAGLNLRKKIESFLEAG